MSARQTSHHCASLQLSIKKPKEAEQRSYERGLAEGKGQGLRQAIAAITAFLSELNTGNTPPAFTCRPISFACAARSQTGRSG
jgi:hypothetical protein